MSEESATDVQMKSQYEIDFPKPSDWQAEISNCVYVPNEGAEPNRFHRWMHRLAFGIVWSKRSKEDERKATAS